MTRCMLGLFAWALTLSAISAAEPVLNPIAELKVTPEKSVFENSAWNKPIVIKSKEDAAKHFGKDALEAIAKSVDFKKQIVLLFAWKGSGGDKLEYQILESFPEQIPFSLKPGATDDLREHSRVFALRANVKWSVRTPK